MRHWLKILCFMFLLISISAEARVLDIIVGGSNAGLECKTDEECGPNRFCNLEQYYCIACKVPMYEWTGTECKCPADRPVETEDDTCVQCLDLTDCKGSEMFCNTDSNTCAECKAPKEWKDNACACPAKTHEAGDDCICDNPNTNLDEFNFCACTLTPASCATTELNLTECMCCPIERPVTIGNECKTCAAIDPSKPVWDSVKKECVECKSNTNCPTNRPICKTDTNTCVQCVETNNCAVNQYCNNTTCSICPANQVRPAGEKNCRCSNNLPLWDGTKCVQQLFTVTWRSRYDTNSDKINKGNTVSSRNPAAIQGYNFDGWYYDTGLTSRASFPLTINNDVTLYAKWNGNYGEVGEMPINKCGGSRLGSEHTYTFWNYWIPIGAKVQAYVRSAWNNDGYNCGGKTAQWKFSYLKEGGATIQDGYIYDAAEWRQCQWLDLGTAPSNYVQVIGYKDWSKYCDVVMRIKIYYSMPAITY